MSNYLEAWAHHLAHVVLTWRQARRLTLRQLQAQIGIDKSALSRLERGFGCDISTLIQLHACTGFTYEQLLGTEDMKDANLAATPQTEAVEQLLWAHDELARAQGGRTAYVYLDIHNAEDLITQAENHYHRAMGRTPKSLSWVT